MEEKRGFASRAGFIISMAAFCVGIGNIWKFPYIVGNNGGGAFLLIYLLMVLLVGFPLFLIELTLGRAGQLAPISAMSRLEGKKRSPWSSIGWFGVIAIFIICSYATMIVGGWTGGYIVKVFSGSMQGLTPDEIGGVFGSWSGSPASLAFSAIVSVLLLLCLISGVKRGVEKVNKVLLPTLLVLMIILAIYANTLPGASEGLLWYLKPDFSKINYSVISSAAIQVFFSIGIGQCCAFVYGSYNSRETNLVSSAATIALLDTIVAVIAGLICVPALFAFGIEPAQGPSLIFITLPQLFNAMGSFGNIFGGLFMICVFFAGFTSMLGGSEALVASLTDATKINRKTASVVVVIAEFLMSILFTFSFGTGTLSKFKLLNLGMFDFADFLASGVCQTMGAILMLAYIIFKWHFNKFQDEANQGALGKMKVANWMKPYFYFILPVFLIIVCYSIVRMYI